MYNKCVCIGKWILDELKDTQIPISQASPAPQSPCETGLEIVSPHKSLATTQEIDKSLPESGCISTTWIGHLGKEDLLRKVRDETAKSVSHSLHCKLRGLALICM